MLAYLVTLLELPRIGKPYNQLNDQMRRYTASQMATATRPDELKLISFNVTTVDALFSERRLALAHWDVEGMEVQVVEGARSVLRRDSPFFTVEVFPRSKPLLYVELMRLVRSLGYCPYAIKETCGFPWDWCGRGQRALEYRSNACQSNASHHCMMLRTAFKHGRNTAVRMFEGCARA